MAVADTILQQLGGRRFITMTGAYSLSGSEDTLSMRLPQRGRMVGVRVTLDPSDTYTLTVIKSVGSLKRGNFRTVEAFKQSNVYCDQLQDVFTEATGLATSLNIVRRNPSQEVVPRITLSADRQK